MLYYYCSQLLPLALLSFRLVIIVVSGARPTEQKMTLFNILADIMYIYAYIYMYHQLMWLLNTSDKDL